MQRSIELTDVELDRGIRFVYTLVQGEGDGQSAVLVYFALRLRNELRKKPTWTDI